MTRRLAYIAAPQRDPNPAVRRWHHDRAVLLGRIALHTGYLPVVPHLVVSGLFPADTHGQPELEIAAMEVCIALVEAVADADGMLFILQRADWSVSAGCRAELEAYKARSRGGGFRVLPWSAFEDNAHRAGLHAEWSALIDPPDPEYPT